jgi:hypothetical protein
MSCNVSFMAARGLLLCINRKFVIFMLSSRERKVKIRVSLRVVKIILRLWARNVILAYDARHDNVPEGVERHSSPLKMCLWELSQLSTSFRASSRSENVFRPGGGSLSFTRFETKFVVPPSLASHSFTSRSDFFI